MPTILVADDNSNIHRMVTNALKDKGIEVIGVANGDAAIKKLEILNPDMVLADVFMPVKDGYELCEWIKGNQRLAAVPVFLLVGAFDPLDEHRVQGVKADGVLKKPFVPPDNLIGAVMAMLDRNAKSRVAAEMESTHTEFASTVPHAEDTQKLSDSEVAEMTGQPAAPPPPEPEMEMYSTRPARLEFSETDQPVGLDAGFAPEDGEEAETEEPAFRPSSLEGMDDASGHGITEEARQPSPDEPPIKVDFGDGGDAPELVTSDSPEGYASMSAVDGAPLSELVGSGEDIAPAMAAAPPPPPPPPAMEMSIPEVHIPEPEPEPAASPMGMPAAELPGLAWSEPAQAAAAPEPPPPPAPAYMPPPPPASAAAPAAPARTPELVPRMMPLSPAQQDALVDEIVDRVVSRIQPTVIHRVTSEISKGLEMLQPQLLERITRDVVRPLAEDLLRKKTDE